MKLLTKINRNLFVQLSIILVIVSIAGYFILSWFVVNTAKESLIEKEYLIKKQLTETGEIPHLFPIIEVKEISGNNIDTANFRTVYIQNEIEDELESYLEYSNVLEINNKFYAIDIRQLIFETNDLVLGLSIYLFLLLLIVFTVSMLITQKMNKTVWKAFEQNIKTIEQFNFSHKTAIALKETKIEEFDRLNTVMNTLTAKLKTDYFALQEFTENAAHEIQTPLSIALLNLEEILQKEIDKETFTKVLSSIKALKRLSTLNQSLILLAKIENKQFAAGEKLNINTLVKQKLSDFSSLIEGRDLSVELVEKQVFELTMHEHLADIMVNNLLSNAINHNIEKGRIHIFLDEKSMKICNSGESNGFNNKTIFDRFAKGNSKSFGLGLAIVKKIGDTHHLNILYSKAEVHCFEISIKK